MATKKNQSKTSQKSTSVVAAAAAESATPAETEVKVEAVTAVKSAKTVKTVRTTKAGPKSQAAQAKVAAKEARQAAKQVTVGEPKPEHGKKYRAVEKLVEAEKLYPLTEAIDLILKTTTTKFASSVELHVRLAQEARGLLTLPNETGKKLTVAVFSDELAEELKKGTISFNILIAKPADMPQLAKYAKLLGPKGLMPNPKSGTVVEDTAAAKQELESGKTEYRTDDGKNVHLVVGKTTMSASDLIVNCEEALKTLISHKILAITLATTMGPGIKVELPAE